MLGRARGRAVQGGQHGVGSCRPGWAGLAGVNGVALPLPHPLYEAAAGSGLSLPRQPEGQELRETGASHPCIPAWTQVSESIPHLPGTSPGTGPGRGAGLGRVRAQRHWAVPVWAPRAHPSGIACLSFPACTPGWVRCGAPGLRVELRGRGILACSLP